MDMEANILDTYNHIDSILVREHDIQRASQSNDLLSIVESRLFSSIVPQTYDFLEFIT